MTSLAALLLGILVTTGLLAGCATSSVTCDDVADLTAQLAAADRDDAAYYDIQDRLNQAQADCNAG